LEGAGQGAHHEARRCAAAERSEPKREVEGYNKWKAQLSLGPEEYLSERGIRGGWVQVAGGVLGSETGTGRWERMTVAGAQKLVPRWARRCTLCFTEVEDAEQVLFRCPKYERLRAAFWLGSGLDAKVEQAAQEVLRWQRRQQHVMWQ